MSGGRFASGLAAPCPATLHVPLSRPRLAVNQVTTFRWSLLQDVIGYQETGVEAIGLWRSKLIDFGEERAVELILDSGLAVSSLSWAGGFTGMCGWSFEESLDDARDALRLARDVGAECLILVSGPRAGHTRNHARRLFVEALQHLAEDAVRLGVKLGVEPMRRRFARNWTFLHTIDDTLCVLDECEAPGVGMIVDTSHLRAEPRLLERIPEIADRVVGVQLNDWRDESTSENDGCLPGDGATPAAEMLRGFLKCGYRGFFEIEAWSDELWRSNYVETLQVCRSKFAAMSV
jgi:sugar phosphate isomerase/epimerase